jgi:para-nitrobenzyl esterase
VAELQLTKWTIDNIVTMPSDKLMAATATVTMRDDKERRFEMRPIPDGRVLSEIPFHSAAPDTSAHVPLIVGTTMFERAPLLGAAGEITESELRKRVEQKHGTHAAAILEVFRSSYPGGEPIDLWGHINLFEHRTAAILQATRKTAQRAAPAYLYRFAWQTPVLDGRPRAFHGSEVALVFGNTERCARMTGATAGAQALAARMTDAWISFARTGNPNHARLPKWQAFTAEDETTMVFDTQCEVRRNQDIETRKIME